ncbi:class I lanthipeptide synthase [Staphylococcus epidermidis]|uniref:lantibiotic dehydratase n=1 Tax=Staphylococcus epidermidis TaxID=1282 RepID=UPI001933B6D7|nr:lantibiotic dehydratase [Staphylococcus epidermidis]MBM0752532.1 enterotoxin [Staphylococcus epidermidis]MBM0765230.1 enterotoxin [Staphylococcus epidermidis]MBM0789505.1 enterotoxin [Staphylococcus epidermidis]
MDNIFVPSNIYMVRTPIFSIELYNQFLKSDNIDYDLILQNDIFKESIMTTTYNLYQSIGKIDWEKDNKKTRNVKESLLKYLIRMSTRSTPYGMLSGVALGEFSENNNIKIKDSSFHKKDVKIDGQWLYKLVHYLESDYTYYKDSFVIWNQQNYIYNNRLYLDNNSSITENKRNDVLSVKYNSILVFIHENSKKNITYEELVQLISSKYSIENKEEIKVFVQELINKEIIFSDLRPTLENKNPLDYIINSLNPKNSLVGTLINISNEITKYSKMPLGKGEYKYLNIVNLMSQLFVSKNYLQIDTYIDYSRNELKQSLADNISEAAYILWLLSPNHFGTKTIRNYHEFFMDKYGFEQLVNLKQLLSDINGFGYPKKDSYSFSNNIAFLKEKYLLAIQNNSHIEITENDVKNLEKNNTVSKINAPVSTEIYSEIYFGNSIKGYEDFAVISPILGSFNAGATFGRFTGNFNIKKKNQLQKEIVHHYNNYMNENDLEISQLNEAPLNSRNVNILNNNRIYNTCLNLNLPKSDIDINDIFIGTTFNKLYLYSEKHDSRIVFVSNSMFNYEFGSELYKFLREISFEKTKFIQPITEEGIDSLPFCPRIIYKNIILKPATWKINSEMFSETEDWLNRFAIIREKWHIPKDVIIAFGDNRLLLNLLNDKHLIILKKELKKHGRIRILESFINESNNERMLEIVTPLYKKTSLKEQSFIIPKNRNKHFNNLKDWFSIHLSIPKTYQDNFIQDYLLPFITELKVNNFIDKFFYIKFKEDEDFIKLRLFREDEDYSQIYSFIKNWKDYCLLNSELYDYSIVDYVPEVYRYGGPHVIEDIENFFMYDSLLSINIIQSEFKIPKEFIVAISIDFLLDYLEINKSEKEEILINNAEDLYRSNDIREYKNLLAKLTNPKNDYEILKKEFPNLHEFLFNKISILETLKKTLQKSLYTSRSRIIGSFIHMRCNRIFGINPEKEKFVLSIFNEITKTKKYWDGCD